MDPGVGSLIDVQPAAQPDVPAVVGAQFTVMELVIEAPDELHAGVGQTVGERLEFGFHLGFLVVVVGAGDENDFLDGIST